MNYSAIRGTNRVDWIDVVKGLAMLLIMWGHVQSNSPLKTWVSSFHVPVFLVLTGILLARKGHVGGGLSYFHKLIYPYITFSVIAIACYSINATLTTGIRYGLTQLVINVYKTMSCYGISAIWFIPSYFIACYTFSKTYHFTRYFQYVLLIVLATMGVVGSLIAEGVATPIEDLSYLWAVYFPVVALFRGVSCSFYLVIGRLIFEIYSRFRAKSYFNWFVLVISFVSLFCSIILSKYLEGTNFSTLTLGNTPYISFVCGAIGSIWLTTLFYLSRKIYQFPVLQWIGRNSLVIMGTHMSLLLTIYVPKIVSLIFNIPEGLTPKQLPFSVVSVVIMLLIEIPIISLFNGPLQSLMKGNLSSMKR